jgi:predicted DNA-binding protein with PD1-like motif
MKATTGSIGRIFIIRLEDGDVVPDCLERFAVENTVGCAQVMLIGGIGGGNMVVGPRHSDEMPPDPMLLPIDGAHEVAAVGLLVPDADGKPMLHIHGALGRAGQTITGCLRPGVKTWLVGEAVMIEVLGAAAARHPDAATGFSLQDMP